ncbi:MAG: tripartite tricarboxylate transporter substrate-binding protein, partial [Bosea sp. (in: a-proteobacteria)]
QTATAIESGANIDMTIWHGLYAGAGTPEASLDRLNAALQVALKEPSILERFKAVGTGAFPDAERSRAAHATRFTGEVKKWAELLKAAGVTPQSPN